MPKALLRFQQVLVSILKSEADKLILHSFSYSHQIIRLCLEAYYGYSFLINQSQLLITVYFIAFADGKVTFNNRRTGSYSRCRLIRIKN